MDAAITDLFCTQIESKKSLGKAKNNEKTVLGFLHPLCNPVLLNVFFLSLYHKGFNNSILPGGGINIVASVLHTHLAGIAD